MFTAELFGTVERGDKINLAYGTCWLLGTRTERRAESTDVSREAHFTLHDFLLVAEPGLVLLLSCEELELISSSSSSSSSKFMLLDIPKRNIDIF